MSIAGYNRKVTSICIPDPAGDITVLVMRAPFGGMRIHNAYASCSAAVTADATNKITMSLLDGGAAGAGTTEMATRVGGASVGWAANEGHALTISQAELDEGDHLLFKYDESGTVAPGDVTLTVEWTQGGTD